MLFNAYYYDCIYSAKGTVCDELKKEYEVSVPLNHHACFGDIYRKIRNNKWAEIEYKIYLYKDNLPNRHFNLCTKLETKKILRSLQKIVEFSYRFKQEQYTVREYGNEKTIYNVLIVKIKGNYAQHLFITTMLRCFFEYPYNVAAKEACVIQATYKDADIDLSKVNWVNLYLTIASKSGSSRLHGIVDSKRQPLAYTYQEWKQKLARSKAQDDIINVLRSKYSYKNSESNYVREADYNEGVLKNRASKYVAAYKEKISWTKR